MDEIERSSPNGYALFCDDIRIERTGKVTLVGAYPSGVIFIFSDKKFPIALPKLCIYGSYFVSSSRTVPLYSIHIILPGDPEDAPSAKITPQNLNATPFDLPQAMMMEDKSLMVGATFQLIMSPFTIKQPGRIRVYAVLDGKGLRIGSLDVKIVPLPPADQQNSQNRT
jgi:hypothetical protein